MNITNAQTKGITLELPFFTPRYLTDKDIDGIVELQDIIDKNLKAKGTPRHIILRSKDYFLEHLSDPHAMYGVR